MPEHFDCTRMRLLRKHAQVVDRHAILGHHIRNTDSKQMNKSVEKSNDDPIMPFLFFSSLGKHARYRRQAVVFFFFSALLKLSGSSYRLNDEPYQPIEKKKINDRQLHSIMNPSGREFDEFSLAFR